MDQEWLYTADECGETPLTRISKSGRMEIATLMFVQTMEDRLKEVSSLPPMHRAAYWGYEDAIADLVEEGEDVDGTDAQGETPLHKAARLGNLEAVRALMEADANPDRQNNLGLTPLHWAALTGRAEVVEVLMERGANPNVRDWVCGGMTPLSFAKLMRYQEVCDAIKYAMAVF